MAGFVKLGNGERVRVIIGGASYAAVKVETKGLRDGVVCLQLQENVGTPSRITGDVRTTFFSRGTLLMTREDREGYFNLIDPRTAS